MTLILGRLNCGIRQLTSRDADDLIKFSAKKTWYGKVLVGIKLALQLKGFITEEQIKNLLNDYDREFPRGARDKKLDELVKIYQVGIWKILVPEENQPEPKERNVQEIKLNDNKKQPEKPNKELKEPEKKELGKAGIDKPEVKKEERSPWQKIKAVERAAAFSKTLLETIRNKNKAKEIPQKIENEEELIKNAWVKLQKDMEAEKVAPLNNNYKDLVGKDITSRKFIASRSPEGDEDEQAVWKNSLDQKFDVILEFTNEGEKEIFSSLKKNDDTFEFNSKEFEDVTVTLKELDEKDNLGIFYKYSLDSTDEEGSASDVARHQYKGWDKNGNITVDQLNTLVDNFNEQYKNEATLILDKENKGRPGTFITAAVIKDKIIAETIKKENYKEKISEIIISLKQGPSVVNEEQFKLLHSYANFLFADQKTLEAIAERKKIEAEEAAAEEAAKKAAELKKLAEAEKAKGPKVIKEEDIIAERWNALAKETEALSNKLGNDIYLKQKSKDNQDQEDTVSQRFFNIACTKKTAAHVEKNGKKEYINANHVGEGFTSIDFIVGQAPLLNPDLNINDYPTFWNVAFKDRDVIIDLSGMEERRSGNSIVTEYAPLNQNPYSEKDNPNGSPQTHGDITVTLVNSKEVLLPISEEESKKLLKEGKELPKYIIYNYKLNDKEGKEKDFQRLHCTAWADFGTIPVDHLDILINLFDTEFRDKNPLIHCRAGVGRSGVYTTARILKEMVEKKEVTAENYREKISEILLGLRPQRGIFDPANCFVQKDDQFALLHSYTKHLLKI